MGEEASNVLGGILVMMIYIVLPLTLLFGSWLIQHLIVSSRRRYLTEREEYFRNRIQMTNLKQIPPGACSSASLVTGAAVIANNYFVSFASSFKHVFGGEMKGYSGMCSDARRLALVRMLRDAEKLGANTVCNVRFETATIGTGDKNQKSAGVELIAYGTAYKRLSP